MLKKELTAEELQAQIAAADAQDLQARRGLKRYSRPIRTNHSSRIEHVSKNHEEVAMINWGECGYPGYTGVWITDGIAYTFLIRGELTEEMVKANGINFEAWRKIAVAAWPDQLITDFSSALDSATR